MGKKTVASYLSSNSLYPQFSFRIKSGLMDALTRDTDEISVRNSTAQVVASIAKHELADRKCPELLDLYRCCLSLS